MSLVSEQERRTLAAVGATRAAAMLASIAFGEEPAEENQNVPPGPQLMGVAIPPETGGKLKRIDVSVTSAGQRGKQLRTEKVANMQDKGHRYTLNSVRRTESYLSYVLHKDGIGKVCHPLLYYCCFSKPARAHCSLLQLSCSSVVPRACQSQLRSSRVACPGLYKSTEVIVLWYRVYCCRLHFVRSSLVIFWQHQPRMTLNSSCLCVFTVLDPNIYTYVITSMR